MLGPEGESPECKRQSLGLYPGQREAIASEAFCEASSLAAAPQIKHTTQQSHF